MHTQLLRDRLRSGIVASAMVALFSTWPASGQQPAAGAGRIGKARLNGLLTLLDEGKAAFALNVNFANEGVAPLDAIRHASDRNLDVVMYDMEHNPFNVETLQTYMQFLVDPGATARAGTVAVNKTIVVRLPASGRELEHNTWQVKQVLDAGVHGVVFSTIETPEQALTAIRAMRYPQRPGVPDLEPDGVRGFGPMVAARYWGLGLQDYIAKADVWRLDPDGHLIPWILIESRRGVENVRAIARTLASKNIGAVLWAGTGDMGMSYGGNQQEVNKAVDAVLAAGKEFGLPVAMNGSADARQRYQQGARIFVGGATPEIRKEVGR